MEINSNSSGDFSEDDAMGSFQNQCSIASEGPCSSRLGVSEKRKRDITALLAETGSSVLPSKRGCKEKALHTIVINCICC